MREHTIHDRNLNLMVAVGADLDSPDMEWHIMVDNSTAILTRPLIESQTLLNEQHLIVSHMWRLIH